MFSPPLALASAVALDLLKNSSPSLAESESKLLKRLTAGRYSRPSPPRQAPRNCLGYAVTFPSTVLKARRVYKTSSSSSLSALTSPPGL